MLSAAPWLRSRVVYPALDFILFDPSRLPTKAECRRTLGLPTGAYLAVLVGRLQRWKGGSVFIDAAPLIAETYPDARFAMVGGTRFSEPHYIDDLVVRTRRSGTEQRFIFRGHSEHPEFWMQAADVIVHASVEPEPFGIVIVEAMALGKSVVASELGGPLEIVEHGVNRMLSPDGDASGFVQAMLWELANPDAFGAGAMFRARQFGPDRMVAGVSAALTDAVQRQTGRPAVS